MEPAKQRARPVCAPVSTAATVARRTRTAVGFTLIELLVVMAIIATLLTLALPRYFGSVDKSKEVTLVQSLATMRDAIDKFYSDNGRYPDQIADLVEKRYLRTIPVDPITESKDTWVVIAPPSSAALKGNVYDVKSGAQGKTREGVEFSQL
jgi:general secretion pathway protein G